MKSHTPVPWKVQDLGARAGHPKWKSFAIRCSATNVHLATVGNVDRYYEGQEEANAAFIVQACNAHEGLLEALEKIKSWICELEGQDDVWGGIVPATVTKEELNNRFQDVRAAIAKAGGRK